MTVMRLLTVLAVALAFSLTYVDCVNSIGQLRRLGTLSNVGEQWNHLVGSRRDTFRRCYLTLGLFYDNRLKLNMLRQNNPTRIPLGELRDLVC